MLTLASMVWAAYMFVADQMHMNGKAPCPVIIQTGDEWKYNEIEDAMYVPLSWKDDCYGQQQIVFFMTKNFNNFRNGKNKLSQDKLTEISKKWVCLTDDK